MLDAPKIYLRNPRHPRLKPGLGFLPNEPKRAARRFKVSSSRFKVCRKIRNEPILSLTPALSRPTGEGAGAWRSEIYQTKPCARRASSKFLVQGSKLSRFAKRTQPLMESQISEFQISDCTQRAVIDRHSSGTNPTRPSFPLFASVQTVPGVTDTPCLKFHPGNVDGPEMPEESAAALPDRIHAANRDESNR